MYEVETTKGVIVVRNMGIAECVMTVGTARHLAGQLLRHADALQYGERYKTLADLPRTFTPAEEIAGLG